MSEKDYYTIDSHIHCGVQNSELGYETIKPFLEKAGIEKTCMFAPVEDIYDRHDFKFEDTEEWIETRNKANTYLKELSKIHPVYSYFFVWNDYPFGDPFEEKLKILSMNFTEEENKLILSGNIERLLGV